MFKSKIEPFDLFQIDCFQNLILSILSSQDIDPCIFGSKWPWTFYKEKSTDEIFYQSFVNEKVLMEFCGYKLIEYNIDTSSIEDLRNLVKNYPIIINVDQFYISHHYPDIYNTKHGPHSLIIEAYDNSNLRFFAIGVLPKYKGWISTEEILKSLNSNHVESKKVYWLEKQYEVGNLEDKVKTSFINSLAESETFENFDFFQMNEMYDIFKRCLKNYQFYDICVDASKKRWFWEIGRLGKIFYYYVKSNKFFPISDKVNKEKILLEIKNIDRGLSVSFKKIYKVLLTKDEMSLNDALAILEKTILDCNSLKEYLYKALVHNVKT